MADKVYPIIIVQTFASSFSLCVRALDGTEFIREDSVYLTDEADQSAEEKVIDGERQFLVMGTVHGNSHVAHDFVTRMKKRNPSLVTAWLSVVKLEDDATDIYDIVIAKGPNTVADLLNVLRTFLSDSVTK